MDRMKTFLKYFIIVILFYFASNVASVYILKSTYSKKEIYPDFDSQKVEITDFKASVSNGYINGKITNNTGKDLISQVLELDFYTKRNNLAGSKFIDLGDLKNGETKDFSTKFNFDNVDYAKASLMSKEEALAKIGDGDSSKLFGIDDWNHDKFPWYVWLYATSLIMWGVAL